MALFGMATTTTAEFTDKSAIDCLNKDFVYILGTDSTEATETTGYDYTQGGCCEEFDEADENCMMDCSGSNKAFCIGKEDKIVDRFL